MTIKKDDYVTARDVCITLKIPYMKLYRLLQQNPIFKGNLRRSSSGDYIYTDDDVQTLKELLYK